jgi:hypothetical protein
MVAFFSAVMGLALILYSGLFVFSHQSNNDDDDDDPTHHIIS